MIQLLRLFCGALIGLLRSSARREAEILVLRHQINVLRRKSPNRPALSNIDRLLFVLLSRLVPTTLYALTVVRPRTVIRWHGVGFRAYKSWHQGMDLVVGEVCDNLPFPWYVWKMVNDLNLQGSWSPSCGACPRQTSSASSATSQVRVLSAHLGSKRADRLDQSPFDAAGSIRTVLLIGPWRVFSIGQTRDRLCVQAWSQSRRARWRGGCGRPRMR